MTTKTFDLGGSLALLGSVVCWGLMPVFLKELTPFLDAWTCNGLRYPLASLLYLPVLARGYLAGSVDRDLFARAVIPSFFALAGQILWALAPYYIPASLIGFLVKVSIIWALAAAMILFPEERALLGSLRFYCGLLLAVAGFTGLAVSQGALELEMTRKGVMIILGCSVFFGLYAVSVRQFLQRVPPSLAFGVVSIYVSLGTIVLMLAYGNPAQVAELPMNAWGLAISSAVLGIAISHLLYYTAIQRFGASISVGVHLLGPFVTLAFAHLILDESMGATAWCAGIAMLAGAALLILAQEKVARGRQESAESL